MPRDTLLHLTAGWERLEPPLDDLALDRLAQYAALLAEWNARINLTAISEPKEIVVRHFLDSLSILPHLDALGNDAVRLIDVGSGGGFPGLPLAIARPGWRVTLLEATRKKVEFLEHVVETLALEGVTPLWGRAEERGRDPAHRAAYDAAVARAVARMQVLAEYCLPFVRVGGRWIAQKGPRGPEELAAARNALGQLGGRLVTVEEVLVPGLEQESRRLIVVDKVRATPVQFPRRAGTPAKRPL